MRGLWERFKRFYNGQDRIDRMNREFEQRMEWHREDIERARKQARAELRDRFAERAMEKMIDAADLCPSVYRDENKRRALAKLSYGIADAMLEARGDAGEDEK